jgi:hypothetical protein
MEMEGAGENEGKGDKFPTILKFTRYSNAHDADLFNEPYALSALFSSGFLARWRL